MLGMAVLAATAAGIAIWVGAFTSPTIPHSDRSPDEASTTSVPDVPPWFRDVTAASGIDFTYRNGEEAQQYTLLETLGGGVALIDYDGDGLLDIFVTGGGYFDGPAKTQIKGHPCKLYRNLGNFRFEDVTEKVGLNAVSWWYTHGVAVADFDRDGWPDLLVTGYGRLALLHNEPDGNGGRKFVDVTRQVGLDDTSWCTGAGWADLDGDGYPDLYVCHYCNWSFANNPICPGLKPGVARDNCYPQAFSPLVHALYRNERGQRFKNIAGEQGFTASGSGLGVLLVDANDDGRPDIYVTNDGNRKFLFVNRGGWKLEERAQLCGVALDDAGHADGSMGVDAADYDGSGRPSFIVTNFQEQLHALYRNLGREQFQYVSKWVGLGALGRHLVGFGTGFLDADNDGWEDLVIAHGHVYQHPVLGSTVKQLPVLMRNVDFEGRRFFRDVGPAAGEYFRTPVIGRGVAVGDLNNDGWPDLVISHTNSPVAVLQNAVGEHAPARWLGIRLVGLDHRDVVGSTVTLETGTRKLTRYVKGGGSYCSASDSRLLFGLGPDGTPRRITVKWSWGETQVWDGLEAGSYWELREKAPLATRMIFPGGKK